MSAAAIRPAGPDDVAAIADVHCQAWRETYRGILPDVMVEGLSQTEAMETWTARLAAASADAVFVAEAGDRTLGFASGKPSNEPEADFDGILDTIYILRAGQGLGLGRRLLGTVAGDLEARGFREMGVVVHADNPALRFYEAMGARRVMERTRLHRGHMCPEVLLSWPLPLSLPDD